MRITERRIITWLVMAVAWGITVWFLISTAIVHQSTPTPYRVILLGIGAICVMIRFMLPR
jgi:hypothetical protein